jgi:hypothetical protein
MGSAERSAASVYGHSTAGIAGSIPNERKDVRLLCLLCVVYVATCATSGFLVETSPTGRVCLIVCDLETQQ